MKKIYNLILLLMLSAVLQPVQAQLNVMEYFFDQDPGVGNGQPITGLISQSSSTYDSVSFASGITIPITMLPGVHYLSFRTGWVDSTNQVHWGNYERRQFFVNSPNGNNLTEAEYFYDQDPGCGNGIPFTLTPSADSAEYAGNLNTLGLSPGYHWLCIRTKDVDGNWGLYERRKIKIINNGMALAQMEYFFDVDPGPGNGTPLSVNSNPTSAEFIGSVSTTGLSSGKHWLYVRAQDILGHWGQYEKRRIHVLENGISIVSAEYFFDQDPGFGNGVALNITSILDSAQFNGTIFSSGLSAGRHTLYVRTKDVEGRWSQYEKRRFDVSNPSLTGEYFFDTDPGVGNATSFSLTSSSLNIAEYSGNLMTTQNLLHGQHWLYARTQLPNGAWSLYDSVGIYIDCSNPVIGQITQTPIINSCGEEGMELTLVNSSLNEGTHWNWYSSSCGVDSVATGATVFVMPNDTSTYYVRGEGGCTNIFNCSSITANYNPASHLDLKMFLQGYYLSGGLMQTTLLNEGQASCANVTDTVFVDLYDPITQNMVHTVKAILHTDGTLRCNFAPFVGEYYIGIRHRNTIETWSSVPIVLGSELVSYDFSLAANKAFSNNMAEVEPGIWGMYCGDPNQDYAVDAFDYLILDPDIVNGANGYLVSDLNGDGSVDAFDYLILQPNIELGVGAQIPF